MSNEKLSRGFFAAFLYALGAALVTCGLLFLNGGLVMALLNAFASEGPQWAQNKLFMQFTLFSAPVLLVIVEWMIIDLIRTRLWRNR